MDDYRIKTIRFTNTEFTLDHCASHSNLPIITRHNIDRYYWHYIKTDHKVDSLHDITNKQWKKVYDELDSADVCGSLLAELTARIEKTAPSLPTKEM